MFVEWLGMGANACGEWIVGTVGDGNKFLSQCSSLMCKAHYARMTLLVEYWKWHTHTRLTALCPGLPGVSRYQKGKTNLDFTEARDSEWQWNPLGHMQVCTSLQTDNHASTPPLSFYRPDALPVAQPTVSKH